MKIVSLTTGKSTIFGHLLGGLVFLVMVGSPFSAWAGDVVLNYTGLKNWEAVYGVEDTTSTTPVTNTDNYTITASGDDSGTLAGVGFDATGIYTLFANVTNNGRITLTGNGGTALSSSADADASLYVTGLDSIYGYLNNTGALTITGTAGNATTTEASSAAYAYIWATGAHVTNNGVSNSGDITSMATGGTAICKGDDAEAWAEADGIWSEGGDVTNSGDITITATGGSATSESGDAEADAWGYGVEVDNGDLTNGGVTSVTASGGSATSQSGGADAYAYALGVGVAGDLNNNANVTATATGGNATSNSGDAYGHAYAIGIETVMSTTTNTGAITVTATGGSATSESGDAYADAWGYGVTVYNGDLTNGGVTSVTASGGSATSQSGGADAYAYALGVGVAGDLNNNTNVTATATGGNATSTSGYADAYAYALGVGVAGDLNNNANVTATATGGNATSTSGYADAYAAAIGIDTDYGTATNTSAITVTATGGSASSTSSSASAYADATGIDAFGGSLSNTAAITVTAIGGSATTVSGTADGDADSYGIYAMLCDVTNSGNITVRATAQGSNNSFAFGIFLEGYQQLTNTGIIRASADLAYEVAVMGGVITLVDTYNLTLDGDPTDGSIYVKSGAQLDLNSATLSLSTVGGETLWDTEYQIFDNYGTVSGAFGQVLVLNPHVEVSYNDQATTDSGDDTVSLSYRPRSSSLLEGINSLRHTVGLPNQVLGRYLANGFFENHLTSRNTPRLYADAGNVVSDAGWLQAPTTRTNGIFFAPYYIDTEKDANPAGFEAETLGFVAGYQRRSDDNRYGFHLGYGHSQIDFSGTGYTGDEEEQKVYFVGLHASGEQGLWTWRGQVTGFYGCHDYEGLTGLALNVDERAKYNSYGVNTTVMAGRMLHKQGHLFLPEVGLNHLWLYRQGFTTQTETAGWEVTHSALNQHQLSGLASIRWLTQRQLGSVFFTPSAAVGVRYLFTDKKFGVNQSVAGSAPTLVKTEQDDLTGTVSASLMISKKGPLSLKLAYDGQFGCETTNHSVCIKIRYMF